MKFLVPNYSCLQNPRLGGYRPQIPVLSVLCPQLHLLNPPQTKFLGTPLTANKYYNLLNKWRPMIFLKFWLFNKCFTQFSERNMNCSRQHGRVQMSCPFHKQHSVTLLQTETCCTEWWSAKSEVSYGEVLGDKITVYIRVTLYWGYLTLLWLFCLVCILYCSCLDWFCNVWVCVCACVGVCVYVGVLVMCGCVYVWVFW